MVAAALVVTCGAGLVQGLGRTDAIGVAWAVVVFGCEAAFTLLAIPVLGRHGPWGVSVHATWLATVMFAVLGMAREGPAAVTRLSGPDWLAVGYLAVAVTAAAFVLWYSSVRRLGASRAGLLTGVAPVAAAATGVLLGGPAPRPLVWAGIAVVAAGLAFGFREGERLMHFQHSGRASGVTFPPWSPGSCTPRASPAEAEVEARVDQVRRSGQGAAGGRPGGRTAGDPGVAARLRADGPEAAPSTAARPNRCCAASARRGACRGCTRWSTCATPSRWPSPSRSPVFDAGRSPGRSRCGTRPATRTT